jgi:CRP/FNR family transcriptional regulator, cyclic AMP receptor protein
MAGPVPRSLAPQPSGRKSSTRSTVTFMAGVRSERIPLLGVEPELSRHIPPADLLLARRHLTARLLEVPAGELRLDPLAESSNPPIAAIVLEGLLLRRVTVMGHEAVQLLGPGDVVPAGGDQEVLLPRSVSISCALPSRLGGLDGQLLLALRRWPGVAAVLLERAGEQIERLAVQHAIGQMPRVQDRIMATMWHLAERHGRVTPAGVHLPVPLTHRLLGNVVGARRPTVSLALAELEAGGALGRRPDRTWMLLGAPPQAAVRPRLARDHA